jgi:lipoate---protein ligase
LYRNAEHEFQPTIRLWVNPPSVIVGRFQEVNMEVDVDLCNTHAITIARRFTGGGTVFHDDGNLNLTILSRRESESIESIQKNNCAAIIASLHKMGVPTEFVPPNSIHVNGRKISGAACALNAKYSLWHASILVSSNTSLLNKLLSPSRRASKSKFVRSKWHPVTTLSEQLRKPTHTESVSLLLMRSIQDLRGIELQSGDLLKTEIEMSRNLYARKYGCPAWNFKGSVDFERN